MWLVWPMCLGLACAHSCASLCQLVQPGQRLLDAIDGIGHLQPSREYSCSKAAGRCSR